MQNVDSVLLPFLNAIDEAERTDLRNELILVHAAPIIRRILRNRLGFYVSASGKSFDNIDARDLYQDIIKKMLQLLCDLQSQAISGGIRDFHSYVQRIAINVCNDYYRDKHLVRNRLKYRIRALLDRNRNLKIWKTDDNVTVCGYVAWYGRKDAVLDLSVEGHFEGTDKRSNAGYFDAEYPEDASLIEIIVETFKQIGRPIKLDDLITLIAKIVSAREPICESLDDADSHLGDSLADIAVGADLRLEGREILERFFEEFIQLPPLERKIILLSRIDHKGNDLWSLLLEAGIITAPQVAEAFGLSADQLIDIWRLIPMSVPEIGEYLGITQQQVTQRKFIAMQQVRDRLSEAVVKNKK